MAFFTGVGGGVGVGACVEGVGVGVAGTFIEGVGVGVEMQMIGPPPDPVWLVCPPTWLMMTAVLPTARAMTTMATSVLQRGSRLFAGDRLVMC